MEIDSEKLLTDLIGINTVNGSEKDIADYIERIFKEFGIKTKNLKYDDNRVTLIAEIGTGEKPVIAFDGHEDTVAFGNLDLWKQSPLEAKIENGLVYGRGSSDMKAGLAAEVLTMLNLKKIESDLKGTVRLYATVGEEVGELGAEQIMKDHLADDVDALVVGEPTGTNKEFLRRKDFYMSKNMSDEQIENLISSNKLENQFFAIIGHKGGFQYKIIAHGKSAHSSMPELGHNAIEDLLIYATLQKKYFDSVVAENHLLGNTTPVVTLLSAGEQINTVPDKAEMCVNIRTIPEKNSDDFEKDICGLVDKLNSQGMNIEMQVLEKLDPVFSKDVNKLANLAKKIAEPLLNQTIPQIGMSGGTDASFIVKNNPDMEVVVFGPGNISAAHQENEFVSLEVYKSFTKIYTDMVINYLQ
ncbi:M20/M25/M40 family metallo-hydrolase [Liquorilactobacillus mali]|uniref:M20/M25/M40 family metallo-hydrolase n=1 Tax=Liquorilactobacillus mali TaxID=1618 RepID=UPI00234FBE28|nr:M20/M25/M40 family metallo-hydrolase [Liquorilactobacillus mali]MDC7952876.1 M20/M25/M40 family metallo-hydrolase [Liquorilactobacillus mali]